MIIYAVTKNTGPTWSGPDPLHLIYLGTSLEQAGETVGDFKRYKKETRQFPDYSSIWSAIPFNLNWEFVQYFMADGWWYTIVAFTLEEQ